MAWTKLDDSVYDHPKLNELDDPAHALLWVWALCWANRYSTDGYLPRKSMVKLATTAHARDLDEAAAELVRAGLWEEAEGGWEVHDFLVYNPSAEEVADLSRKRSDAGRRGGIASGETRSKTEASASKQTKQTAKRLPKQNRSPSRPVPLAIYSSSGPVQQGISTGPEEEDQQQQPIDLMPEIEAAWSSTPAPIEHTQPDTADSRARQAAIAAGELDMRRASARGRAIDVPSRYAAACARDRWAQLGPKLLAAAREHPDLEGLALFERAEADQLLAMAAHPGGTGRPAAPGAPPRESCGWCGDPLHRSDDCAWHGVPPDEVAAELECSRRELDARGEP